MKQEIHPEYREITVVMTDGTEFKTRSTYASSDRLQLDIDPKTHPAWTGTHRMVDRGGQLAKFNKRFGGLSGKKEEAATAPAATEAGEKIKLTTKAAPAAKPAAKKKKA
jgi:large subunit ribosomal protein L31